MTAAAASDPHRSSGPPFINASPADVRAALVPEDVAEFDREWRAAMAAATENLDLTVVHETLDAWRRIAWLTIANGPDGYRRMLAGAAETLRTGALPPGSVPLTQVKAMIARRLS